MDLALTRPWQPTPGVKSMDSHRRRLSTRLSGSDDSVPQGEAPISLPGLGRGKWSGDWEEHFCAGNGFAVRPRKRQRETALTEKFNLQLAGSVFCYLEEAALTKDSYLKIKEWIDSPRMTIRAMRRDGYSLPNYAHFMQSGNKTDNCPFELGDTRVVVIEVPPIAPEDWLDWKTEFIPELEEEAPAFLGGLWAIPLPKKGFKRLYLPVLVTAAKQTIIEASRRESQERDGRKTPLQAIVALVQQNK